MVWSAARGRWGGRSSAAKFSSRRLTIPTWLKDCRPDRSQIPGRASLEAAANPARTRDLFFVADGTGGHSFTETYEQHQKNVARLRTMEKQIQNDTVEPADDPPPTVAPHCCCGHRRDRRRARRETCATKAIPASPAGRGGASDRTLSGNKRRFPRNYREFRSGSGFHSSTKPSNVGTVSFPRISHLNASEKTTRWRCRA